MHNDLAIGSGAEAQLRMRLYIILERKLLILVAHHRTRNQRQHQILWHPDITLLRHAPNLYGNALKDLRLEVNGPAVLAERMPARQAIELVVRL